MKKGKKTPLLDREGIDLIVTAQAEDESAWEAPIRVKRTKPASSSLPEVRAVNAMLRSHRSVIKGIPYSKEKTRGDIKAQKAWEDAVQNATRDIPDVRGPCLVRVTFRLAPQSAPADHPFGNDIDNLLKLFLDALKKTVFSKAPGEDGCVVAVEAAKVGVANRDEAGADLEIIPLPGGPTGLPNRAHR